MLACGVSEKDQHCIAGEFGDSPTVPKRDGRHLHKILIEQARDLLRLQLFGSGRKVSDVGKEDGKLLALGSNCCVVLAIEDAVVDLRWEIARKL